MARRAHRPRARFLPSTSPHRGSPSPRHTIDPRADRPNCDPYEQKCFAHTAPIASESTRAARSSTSISSSFAPPMIARTSLRRGEQSAEREQLFLEQQARVAGRFLHPSVDACGVRRAERIHVESKRPRSLPNAVRSSLPRSGADVSRAHDVALAAFARFRTAFRPVGKIVPSRRAALRAAVRRPRLILDPALSACRM